MAFIQMHVHELFTDVGGIGVQSSNVTITSTYGSFNHAKNNGGFLTGNFDSTVFIQDSIFKYNSATQGLE